VSNRRSWARIRHDMVGAMVSASRMGDGAPCLGERHLTRLPALSDQLIKRGNGSESRRDSQDDPAEDPYDEADSCAERQDQCPPLR
jgi:hypothetical protein